MLKFLKNVDDVKKKIKNLRSAEKKKVDNFKKSGSSAEALYEPHLFYFSEMCFLDSVVVLRKTSSNINSETNVEIAVECLEEEDDPMNQTLTQMPSPLAIPTPSARSSQLSMPSKTPSTSSSFPSSSASTSSISRRRRNRGSYNDAKFDKAIEAIVSSATKPEVENVFTFFAKTIAKQLEQLQLITATETMSQIHCIVTRKVIEHLAASQQESDRDSDHDIVQMLCEKQT